MLTHFRLGDIDQNTARGIEFEPDRRREYSTCAALRNFFHCLYATEPRQPNAETHDEPRTDAAGKERAAVD